MEDFFKGLCMPDIPSPTMGGKVLWNELASCRGWRLQKNVFTDHHRILNPENACKARGDEDRMLFLFQRVKNKLN